MIPASWRTATRRYGLSLRFYSRQPAALFRHIQSFSSWRQPATLVHELFPTTSLLEIQALAHEYRARPTWKVLQAQYFERRRRLPLFRDFHFALFLLARVLRPAVIVETGVFDGVSSTVLLEALALNGKGTLISIDLPALVAIPKSTDCLQSPALPLGAAPGWAIPQILRRSHELLLGSSRDILPTVVERTHIDMFVHDSQHTDDVMDCEYRTAWRALGPAGVLVSDDVIYNSTFRLFCTSVAYSPLHCEGGRVGVIRRSQSGIAVD